MYKPTSTDKTITLCGKIFKIYNLQLFDFNEDIDITSDSGVYCFTKYYNGKYSKDDKHFCVRHNLLYVGKADGKEGLRGRLTKFHDKFNQLKKAKCSHLCVYVCQDGEDPKKIESEILSEFQFTYNDLENTENTNKPFNVAED